MLNFVTYVIFLFSPPSINIFGNSPLKKVADGFLGACLCLSKGELFLMYYNGNLTCRQFVYISFKIVVLYYQKNIVISLG